MRQIQIYKIIYQITEGIYEDQNPKKKSQSKNKAKIQGKNSMTNKTTISSRHFQKETADSAYKVYITAAELMFKKRTESNREMQRSSELPIQRLNKQELIEQGMQQGETASQNSRSQERSK